jgi:hypothetical protein
MDRNEEMLGRLSLEICHQNSLRILKKQKQISLYSTFRATNLLRLTPYKINKSHKIEPIDPTAKLKLLYY